MAEAWTNAASKETGNSYILRRGGADCQRGVRKAVRLFRRGFTRHENVRSSSGHVVVPEPEPQPEGMAACLGPKSPCAGHAFTISVRLRHPSAEAGHHGRRPGCARTAPLSGSDRMFRERRSDLPARVRRRALAVVPPAHHHLPVARAWHCAPDVADVWTDRAPCACRRSSALGDYQRAIAPAPLAQALHGESHEQWPQKQSGRSKGDEPAQHRAEQQEGGHAQAADA